MSANFFTKIKNLTLNFGPQHPAAHGARGSDRPATARRWAG